MLTSTRFSTLIIALLACLVRSSSADVSANCTLETVALSNNDRIQTQAKAINQDAQNQIKVCIDQKKDDCNVQSDYSSYKTACEAEGGQVYEPSTTFECKQGVYVSKVTTTYITCVGSSCNTDEFSKVVNDKLQNYTNVVSSIVNVDGIECKAEFSGAYSLFGFAALAASMIVTMVLA